MQEDKLKFILINYSVHRNIYDKDFISLEDTIQ